MNTDTQEHLAWLQDKLATYESKLTNAESAVAKLRPIVLNLRGTIEALTSDGQELILSKDLLRGQPVNNGDQIISAPLLAEPAITKRFTVGNHNPNMPARRSEFANSTLIQAAGQVINNNSPNTMHADEITNAVFVIETRAQFKLAKHSVASELYRGARKGLWEFLGQNRYRHK